MVQKIQYYKVYTPFILFGLFQNDQMPSPILINLLSFFINTEYIAFNEPLKDRDGILSLVDLQSKIPTVLPELTPADISRMFDVITEHQKFSLTFSTFKDKINAYEEERRRLHVVNE